MADAQPKGPKLNIKLFDPCGDRIDMGRRWSKWIERFERELRYKGVDASVAANSGMAQMALLIYAGPETEDIHDTLPQPVKPENITNDNWTEYLKSKTKLELYFSPKQNNDFALHQLLSTKPTAGESIAEYTTRLRKASDKCNFANWTPEKMIKCVLISNILDEELRLKFLQKEYTLDEILDIARRKEDAKARSKVMKEEESTEEVVNKIKYANKNSNERGNSSKGSSYMENRWKNRQSNARAGEKQSCIRCGQEKHLSGRDCPANGQTCSHCKRTGHFSNLCFSKSKSNNVKVVEQGRSQDLDSSDTDEEEILQIKEIKRRGKGTSLMKIKTSGVETLWQPDTGTSRNIWDEARLHEFERQAQEEVALTRSNIKLFPYGGGKCLTVLGKFRVTLQAGKHQIKTSIYVTKEKSRYPLLSEKSAKKLHLIKYNEEFLVNKIVHRQEQPEQGKDLRKTLQDMITKHKGVFSGKIGKLNTHQVSLMIDEEVKPVVQKPRKIPYNLADKACKKVDELLKAEIIQRVPDNRIRTWVNPPVIAAKPKTPEDIRFCVDMRLANKAILRPYTQIPTMEDMVYKFHGATRYSKLDLKEAYHQLELDEKSRDITTFYGPDGLYQYCRLNYGTKSAQDILQAELQKQLSGIPHQMNISDDVLIGAPTMDEHDETLEKVLSTLNRHGMTVNVKKCVFDVDEIAFSGLVFNAEGIRPDPKNVKNLKEADAPGNKAELKSFLGMAGYSEQFIPDYANIAAPLRELANESRWRWSKKHQKAFDKVKGAISEESLLHHYVVGMETELAVDASTTGLGAVLLQRSSESEQFKPVLFKSRALKDVEKRYSTTEREALAIRWAAKRLRKYLVGSPKFKIVTDHKPLVFMFQKKCGDLPPRVERFVMDIQDLDYEIVYKPGKLCIADYLSRKHCMREGSSRSEDTEEYVKTIVEMECASAINYSSAVTLNDIKVASETCKTMKKLKKFIHNGKHTSDPELKPYMVQEIRSDLNMVDGLVCRGKRLVIPPSLRKKVVSLSHAGHQGISRAKSLIRTFCWFPGIDKMVENEVTSCLPCQRVQPPRHKEPIKPTELPKGPWQEVEMDFQGPYPQGEYILALVDRYSHWPETAIFSKAPTAKMLIEAMKGMFAQKGVPYICQSDNGPPFQSKDVAEFAQEAGFYHHRITPEWPRANGTVERFNRSMKEAIQTANQCNVKVRQAAREFVQAYRATPHKATNVSPFSAMHGGREMRNKLPLLKGTDNVINRDTVTKYKENMKKADTGVRHNFSIGDTVIMQTKKKNKLTPCYGSTQLKVSKVQGSTVTAQSENGKQVVVRDASMFRRIRSTAEPTQGEDTIPHDEDGSGSVGVDTHDENDTEQAPGDSDTEGVEDDYKHGQGDNDTEVEEPVGRPIRQRRAPEYLNDYVVP